MNKRVLSNMACLTLLLVTGVAGATAAEEAKREGQLTGTGEKLLAQYAEMLTALSARSYPHIRLSLALCSHCEERCCYARNYGTDGGLWNALAFYQKKAIVEDAKPIEIALTGEDLAEANLSTKAEKVIQTEVLEADRKIVVDKDGVITIPAVACSKPTNNTAKIVFMKSFLGGMQLHYNRLGDPEVFEYVIEAPKAGKYALTARVVTVNMDHLLLLTSNYAESAIDIHLPYTVGRWEESKPAEVSLAKGKNTLRFTREAPDYGLTIKDFTLKPLK